MATGMPLRHVRKRLKVDYGAQDQQEMEGPRRRATLLVGVAKYPQMPSGETANPGVIVE